MARSRSLIAAAVAAASCAGLLLLPSQAQAAGSVHIETIYYNSPGSPDSGGNTSLNGEWVRIRNSRDVNVSLKGWTIRDSSGHTYTFGSYTLAAGRSVTVHTGKGDNTARHRYWGSSWYVWNNDADRATLRRGNGTVADRCSYVNANASSKSC
ncbi:lamin tail domain-containing protein [Streptomyces sp. 6N223]|uniref:lamin tail domain-containing protein n=1 Tax=Streptomyces sp. 6N223 TaxID=3457412 RepID=UPI003FD506E0